MGSQPKCHTTGYSDPDSLHHTPKTTRCAPDSSVDGLTMQLPGEDDGGRSSPSAECSQASVSSLFDASFDLHSVSSFSTQPCSFAENPSPRQGQLGYGDDSTQLCTLGMGAWDPTCHIHAVCLHQHPLYGFIPCEIPSFDGTTSFNMSSNAGANQAQVCPRLCVPPTSQC